MRIITMTSKKIENVKDKLRIKAKRNWIYENFWEKEINQIFDHYWYSKLIYWNDVERLQARMLEWFRLWCQNFTILI